MFVLPICPRQLSIRAKLHITQKPELAKFHPRSINEENEQVRVGSACRVRHGLFGGHRAQAPRGEVDVPFGQVFHKSSFTRPTVVSGSNAIDLRRPETSKNCTSVCGTCGTAAGAPVSSCSCCTSSSCGAPASAPPSSGTASSGWL